MHREHPARIALAPLVAVLLTLFAPLYAADAPVQSHDAIEPASPEAMRSPVNQVFQFAQTGEPPAWPDGFKRKSTAYLWIPEDCKRLRGLLILCWNVPEHMLVGNPAIRKVCAAHDLGIVWCCPTFCNLHAEVRKDPQTPKKTVAYLQQLLDGLAKSSGYEEVATVPWLPMGESMQLMMVDLLVDEAPQRCLAGVWIKNCHFPPKNRETPAFTILGSSQEWNQAKSDIRSGIWNKVTDAYNTVLDERKKHPNWPLSVVFDGGSGHFDCSERLTQLIARYIDWVATVRLSSDGSPNLKPVDMKKGFLADLPVPGHENQPITAFASVPAEAQALPWFYDKAFAEEAQSIARINWQAETQFPLFATEKGEIFPNNYGGGITKITVNKKPEPMEDGTVPPMIITEEDGITFTVKGVMADKIPKNFVAAGQPLAKAPGSPTIEWICGGIEPIGNGKFRFALDRVGTPTAYIGLQQRGTDKIRAIVEPAAIDPWWGKDAEGTPQTIVFQKIPDIKAGTPSLPLIATSDSKLPVRFFVKAGPAIVEDGKLVFTKIPPRTRFPILVTVSAWQMGRYANPKIKPADIVSQTFQILEK